MSKTNSLARVRHRAVFVAASMSATWIARSACAAGQPYAPYFFPGTPISDSISAASSILSWNPATDPDAPFNVSTVPLAARFTPTQVNPNVSANASAGVTSLVSFGTTSYNPAQGSASMVYYTPTYWQYTNQLVFFGGSAGEGSILVPNAPITDAAHRNGVPVLGNIFLGPTTYGGSIQQVNDLIQETAGGDFPVADKLIQAAQYYHFDGWFINQETAGGNSTTATQMQAFIKYIHAQDPGLTIEWYDAMTTSGSISYQNQLDSSNNAFFQQTGTTGSANKVADSVFLNYNWNSTKLTSSANLANSDGRSPYSLYAGLDVQANSGYNANTNSLSGVFPSSASQTMSLGLFGAQQTLAGASGSTDLAKLQSFYSNESLFWTGANGNPANTATVIASTNWYGIANYIPVQSTVTAAPFVTNFATGQGQMYSINGQTMATGEWNNLSLQDVQPTWRWLLTTTASTQLTPSLDFTKAYFGGASLNIAGSTTAANNLNLYATRIPVAANTNFSIAYTDGAANTATNLSISLAFTDGTVALLPVQNTTSAGWNTEAFSLGSYSGKTLSGIGLQIDGTNASLSNYSLNVGQLAVYNGAVSTPAAVTNLYQSGGSVTSSTDGTVRLQWNASASSTYACNLYQQTSGGSLTWVGGTTDNAYFIQDVKKQGGSNFVNLQVETVAPDFGLSIHATVSAYVDWTRNAQTLNWEGNGSTPGGAGTWNTASTDWNAGSGAPANQFWSNSWNDSAVFGTVGGTVAVATPVTVNRIVFNASGYRLTGNNPITLAGTGAGFSVNTNVAATVATPIIGSVGLIKSGNGSLLLSAANYYTGGTTINSGSITVSNPLSLSTGAVTLNGGTLAVAVTPAVQPLAGFDTVISPSLFTLTKGNAGNGPSFAANATGSTLILTDGNNSETNSVFSTQPVALTNVAGFSAHFTYEPSPVASGAQADGIAFVVQNDPRKTAALGDGGGTFGYAAQGSDTNQITNSLAVYLNIYNTTQTGLGTNGSLGTAISTSPVNFALGDPYLVTLIYSGTAQTLTQTITDTATNAAFTHTYTGINLASLLNGPSAYIGFTAGTGGVNATQTITNFSFSSNINSPAGILNSIITAGTATSVLSIAPAANGVASSTGPVTVSANSTLQITSSTASTIAVLNIPSLTLAGLTNNWNSKLDLTTQAIDLTGGNLSTIQNQIASAFAGDWIGPGIGSSAASSDPSQLTAVGYLLNTTNGSTALYGIATPLGLFEGDNPSATDILIKVTYYGDANLDGKVDGSDYSLIDNGFNTQATGWYNGDFNYDGVIDGSDYTLIDNAFNQQGAQITAAVSTAQIAGPAAVPEPCAAGASLLLSTSALIRRRRRDRPKL